MRCFPRVRDCAEGTAAPMRSACSVRPVRPGWRLTGRNTWRNLADPLFARRSIRTSAVQFPDARPARARDRLSATVISTLPPEDMTETELRVFVQNAPAPAPRRAARPAPLPAPASTAPSMPHTASPVPAIGFAGVLLLGIGIGLTVFRRFVA